MLELNVKKPRKEKKVFNYFVKLTKDLYGHKAILVFLWGLYLFSFFFLVVEN